MYWLVCPICRTTALIGVPIATIVFVNSQCATTGVPRLVSRADSTPKHHNLKRDTSTSRDLLVELPWVLISASQ